MRKMRRKYKRPKSPWNGTVIDEERKLLREFGLKNKKELWKARSTLRLYRARAREITATRNDADQKALLDRLVKFNILTNVQGIDDVLALTLEDILNRRLQTILFRKNLANTLKQSRQLIVHGHVLINNRKMIFPSYFVPTSEEGLIEISQEMRKKMAESDPKSKGRPEPKTGPMKEKPAAQPKPEPASKPETPTEKPKEDAPPKEEKPAEETKSEPASNKAETKTEGGK